MGEADNVHEYINHLHVTTRSRPRLETFGCLGYELGSLGMTLDRQQRRFCRDPSATSCAVCLGARKLAAEEQLFYSGQMVVLAPVQGEVPRSGS